MRESNFEESPSKGEEENCISFTGTIFPSVPFPHTFKNAEKSSIAFLSNCVDEINYGGTAFGTVTDHQIEIAIKYTSTMHQL